jgi:L-threonylcarbamoyladenylate synthase
MKTIISDNINKAIELLKNDKVIGFPTETVYGLAGNALSIRAIEKIYEVKQRPKENPLILHIANKQDLSKYCFVEHEVFLKLADKFWPGPITFLLNKTSLISEMVTASKPKVAVRIPNHEMALRVLKNIDFPLVAPSANPFNYISPTSAQHVKAALNAKIEFILDGGKCDKGIESTIVGMHKDELIIYRPGTISLEDIKKIYPKVKLNITDKSVQTPGMFKKHYSPKTPLIATHHINREIKKHSNKKLGVLTFTSSSPINDTHIHYHLSPNLDYNEAAHNLYDFLYKLDAMNLDLIIVELLPEGGMATAINDRIKKASAC